MGLPTITTRVGARGFDVNKSKKNKNINNNEVIISSINDFPKNIYRLIHDNRLSGVMGENGARFAKKYDWKILGKEAKKIYYELL